MAVKGSLVAIVTPMCGDGAVDFDALDRLIDWQIWQGTDGVVSVGTTGESATLDEQAHCEVIRHTVERVGGRVPVIAGTGANATSEAIRLTRCAREAGADACLLVTPYYNKPPQEGLYRHFMAVADAVGIPQILYNVPGRTCCDLQNDTVVRLSRHQNIIGLKDATGELDRLSDIRQRVPDDFLLYSGDDESACEFILAGGDGVITVTGNVVPKAMREMVEAALAGDAEKARALDRRLQPLHRALFIETSPIPTKWALARLGMISRGIRLPLTWMREEHQPLLEQAMHDAGAL